jgi:hypothetical protein
MEELDTVIWDNEEREREHLVEQGAKLMTLMEEEKMTKQMWKQEAERERQAKEEYMLRIREFEQAKEAAMR